MVLGGMSSPSEARAETDPVMIRSENTGDCPLRRLWSWSRARLATMTIKDTRAPLLDGPIESSQQDRLQRGPFADAIAAQILSVDVDEGFVIGVTGPWGSGKASLLNLIEESIDSRAPEIFVLRFNPWLYSDAEELVVRFLIELGNRLQETRRGRYGRLGKLFSRNSGQTAAAKLRDYAEVVKPVGGIIGTVAAVAGGAASRVAGGSKSTTVRRDAATAALRDLDTRVVVFIDDLDRVEDEQIREMVRLVKLVGDFPRTVYVLSYDAGAVAHAVGRGDQSKGRSYMEKIVQAEHSVPLTPDWLINEELLRALDVVFQGFAVGEIGPFDSDHWQEVYVRAVRPFFS